MHTEIRSRRLRRVGRAIALAVLLSAPAGVARAQQAQMVTGFLGARFYDIDSALETSPVVGARWGWFARSGHGFEFAIDYTESRLETGQIALLLGVSFEDPQALPEQLETVSLDYAYVARGGVVRPYAMIGAGYVRAEIALSNRAERLLESLNRSLETSDTSAVYQAAFGVLVGEERLRFRYDARLVRIDSLFGSPTTVFQMGGGFSWIF